MSSLQTQAALVVAAFDLKVVQLLRDAIRTADISSAADNVGAARAANPEASRRRHIHPDPVYEPRVHVHPTPVYEARPVIHAKPRVEMNAIAGWRAFTPIKPMHGENPIQPPWKILPWENAVQPRQTVKIHLIRTDVVHKGTVLDLFV